MRLIAHARRGDAMIFVLQQVKQLLVIYCRSQLCVHVASLWPTAVRAVVKAAQVKVSHYTQGPHSWL